MTLEDIKQLTLREILFLTEGKFSISMNKPIFENHKDYSFEKFELITVDLSITNCHLTKNFVSNIIELVAGIAQR